MKSNGINIGKIARVSYFDKIGEELTPKNGNVMSFDTSEDRNAKSELSNKKMETSTKKPLTIDIKEDLQLSKSDMRSDLTPTSKQLPSTKNNYME